MSVLIKGMEMPTSKPICIVIDVAGQARQYDLNNEKFIDDELYEAVPIPPHGDLIDRDKMFAAFVEEGQKSKRYKIGERWELNGEEIRHVIANLPDVIPAEPPREEDK